MWSLDLNTVRAPDSLSVMLEQLTQVTNFKFNHHLHYTYTSTFTNLQVMHVYAIPNKRRNCKSFADDDDAFLPFQKLKELHGTIMSTKAKVAFDTTSINTNRLTKWQ